MEEMALNDMVDQLARAKDIEREVVIEALEAALNSASRRSHLNIPEMDIHLLDEEDRIVIVARRTVVEEATKPGLEISLEEAREVDPEAEVGDEMDFEISPSLFGRNAAQIAKQVVIQRLREAERGVILEEYQGRIGEVVSGVVKRESKGTVVIDLGRTEAVMPYRERLPGEEYRVGDRVRAYLTEVRETTKGAQIIVSRAHPDFLSKLFELEVPEIYEGLVKIHVVAREPGSRSKIAVSSRDKNIDPVGTCVGMRGYRVQAVVRELSGEKVDIVRYATTIEEFTRNALAPAQITAIEVDEDAHHIVVVVPEHQLSLAIGRGGQNVRLAAKLLGWHLDIISEREREELAVREEAEAAASYDFLISLPGVGEKTALALYEYGFGTADEILAATPEQLTTVPGVGPKSAVELKEKVAAGLAALAEQGLAPPRPEDYMEAEAAPEAEAEETTEAEEPAAEAEEAEPETEAEGAEEETERAEPATPPVSEEEEAAAAAESEVPAEEPAAAEEEGDTATDEPGGEEAGSAEPDPEAAPDEETPAAEAAAEEEPEETKPE
ncbi:MAG: transcription termination/antitermination protein NusA [Candidatus Coatesbacteria bacterium]|nr:MAG: transcription termination/antitermination protein NusA [Candidatus Coatesbacteria bacterium]